MDFLQNILKEGDEFQAMHEAHLEDFRTAFDNTSPEKVGEYDRILKRDLPAARKKLLTEAKKTLGVPGAAFEQVMGFIGSLGVYLGLNAKIGAITVDYSISSSPLVDSSIAFTVREPGSQREARIRAESPVEEQRYLASKIVQCIADDLATERDILDKVVKRVGADSFMLSLLLVELLKVKREPRKSRALYMETAKTNALAARPRTTPFPFRSLGLCPAGPWSTNLDPLSQAARVKADALVITRVSPLCVRYVVSQLVDEKVAEPLATIPECGISKKLVDRMDTVRSGTRKKRPYAFRGELLTSGTRKKIAVFEKCGDSHRPLVRGRARFGDNTVALSDNGAWVNYFLGKRRTVSQRVQAYQDNRQKFVQFLQAPIEEDEIQRRSESLSQYSKLREDLLVGLRKYARGRPLDRLTNDENFLKIVPETLIKTFRGEYERGLKKSVTGQAVTFSEIAASFLSQISRISARFSKELFDMHRAGMSPEKSLEAAVDKIVRKNENAFQSIFYRIELLRAVAEQVQK